MQTANKVRRCRVCACTEDSACVTPKGPCYWVEKDLCSACRGERFKVVPHTVLPGKMIVEYWIKGKFVAGIYPHQDGIRVVSKYMAGVVPVVSEAGYPPAVIVKLGDHEC